MKAKRVSGTPVEVETDPKPPRPSTVMQILCGQASLHALSFSIADAEPRDDWPAADAQPVWNEP